MGLLHAAQFDVFLRRFLGLVLLLGRGMPAPLRAVELAVSIIPTFLSYGLVARRAIRRLLAALPWPRPSSWPWYASTASSSRTCRLYNTNVSFLWACCTPRNSTASS